LGLNGDIHTQYAFLIGEGKITLPCDFTAIAWRVYEAFSLSSPAVGIRVLIFTIEPIGAFELFIKYEIFSTGPKSGGLCTSV
jgi:hypothetical protein